MSNYQSVKLPFFMTFFISLAVSVPESVAEWDKHILMVVEDKAINEFSPIRLQETMSGWTTYTNNRFGTSIKYPTSHFLPAGESPANNDGRSFASDDRMAELLVWGGYNALEQTPAQIMDDVLATFVGATLIMQQVDTSGVIVKFQHGATVVQQRSILGPGDIVHNVRVLYPLAQDKKFSAAAQAIADSLITSVKGSFSGRPQLEALARAAPSIVPAVKSESGARGYYTPAHNTAERNAIMDATRIPMLRVLGQKVIFLVSQLRTDGEWCFLMAEPLQPDGKKLNWYSTRYANDWANDAVSDLVMVLLRKQSNEWQVVDYVVGPKDVHWYNWIDVYGLPELLFNPS